MSDFVSPLLQWLNANPEWAGFATFVISAAESIAIIGTVVPGSITMTAIGTLAGAGVIPLGPTIFWAIMGAIVGDGVSYWMGHYFKDRVKLMWPFRTNPYVLNKGEAFVRHYGVMSVFIGRFVGPVRALVPLVAGMLGMKPLQFTIANVASAIGWAPAYMLPGILLGAASLELPPDIAIHVILVFLIIVLFVLLCLWLLYKLFLQLHHQLHFIQTRAWRKLQSSPIFSPTTILLQHYDSKKSYGQFSLALIFMLSSLLFLALIFYVKYIGAQNIAVNDVCLHFFRGLSLRGPTLDQIMVNITVLGQKQILAPVVLVLTLCLLVLKRYRAAIHVVLLAVLATGAVSILKKLISIPRPWGLAKSIETYSMPSGHTTLAVTLYIGIAWLLLRSVPARWRPFWYAIALTLAILISISRLYLGAHWFTDVFAGWLLSIAILSFIMISYQRKWENALPALNIFIICFLTFILAFIFYHYKHRGLLLNPYKQASFPVVEINEQEWWLRNGNLPAYNVSLFGFPAQRINIEWAGNLATIKAALTQEGWTRAPARDIVSTIHRIADVSSAEYLPMISPQYLDNRPALILTRMISSTKRMMVIRLWDSNRQLMPSKEKLWVGTVNIVPRTYSWLRPEANGTNPNYLVIFPNGNAAAAWQWKLLQTNVPLGPASNKWIKRKVLLIKSKNP